MTPISLTCASASKALSLANQAELELVKNSPESISNAIEILQQVIKDPSFHRQNLDAKVSIFLLLSSAYQKKQEFSRQKELIESLIKDKNFSRFSIQLKLHLADSLLNQNRIVEADQLLAQLEREPRRRLVHAEITGIVGIKTRIENGFEKMLQQAQTHFQAHRYKPAKALFTPLFQAVVEHRFPQTKSLQSRQSFQMRVGFGLAMCHYLLQEFDACLQLTHSLDLPHLAGLEENIFWKNKKLYAYSCMHLRQFDRANSAIKSYLTQFPNDHEARIHALFSALKAYRFLDAIVYEKQLEAKPLTETQSSKLTCYKALSAIETNNPRRALELICTCSEPDSLFLQGYLFSHINRHEDAVFFLEKSIPYYPQNAYALLTQCYEELTKQKANPQVYVERAKSCQAAQQRLYPVPIQTDTASSLAALHTLALRHDNIAKLFYKQLSEQNCIAQHPFFASVIRFLIKSNKAMASELLDRYEAVLLQRSDVSHLLEECAFLRCLCMQCTDERVQSFFERYPHSIFASELLFFAGLTAYESRVQERAGLYFSRLLDTYPDYPRNDEALYFYARTSKAPELIYQKLYETYPDSPFATEAYFRMFKEIEYINGTATALLHLKKMPENLKQGPFWIISMFYIAQNIRNESPEHTLSSIQCSLLTHALSLYEKVVDEIQSGKRVESSSEFMNKIAMQARLEAAKTRITIATTHLAYEACLSALSEIKKMIEDECYTQTLFYHALWQESSKLSAQVLLLLEKKAKAREELQHLIDYGKTSGLLHSEPILSGLCLLAEMHMSDRQYAEAKKLLEFAEEIHATDETNASRLHIWLYQSELAKKTGNHNLAMKLLSTIINDDSASSLRVQAMYLRAELYEKRSRRDLALKQLEACAKKGGVWAERAKKKLETEYGHD